MRIAELPEHLVIVGGGFVAAEFAHVFSALGVRVTIVVRGGTAADPLRRDDLPPVHRHRVEEVGSANHENVVGAHQDGDRIVLELDDGTTLTADMLLVATGRVPNGDQLDAELAGVEVDDAGLVVVDEYQRTTARGIFALGDVSLGLSAQARRQSRDADRCGTTCCSTGTTPSSMQATDHRFVPVGGVHRSADRDGRPDRGRGRAQRHRRRHQGAGLRRHRLRLGDGGHHRHRQAHRRPTTGKILGAHVMGHQASSIIQPIIQAMSFGQTAQEVARGQYWIHPALPEVIENALLGLCGEPPWPLPPPLSPEHAVGRIIESVSLRAAFRHGSCSRRPRWSG